MSRVVQDQNLLEWEVYASTGDHGFADQPHIVFDCLTDRSLRPRFVEHPGMKADAEKAVQTLSDADLLELFSRSEPMK